MRSITNFTCFVNGEKLTQFQTNATTFETPKNSVVIGASSNGSIAHHGGIFSAGWGTSDPGDDFFTHLLVGEAGECSDDHPEQGDDEGEQALLE